jgi:hypothetical protein
MWHTLWKKETTVRFQCLTLGVKHGIHDVFHCSLLRPRTHAGGSPSASAHRALQLMQRLAVHLRQVRLLPPSSHEMHHHH